ncbi:fizzy-related protein homolog isoform X2 [Cynoglossus semilaevis]|uniref:Fizzy/cell division cycle 20 related 1a n=1 Tax=Cynoglossus semilaevis TaxID=244447 RepID=A0A3P8WBA3_CYNSE|nr:fizzy-related protein homolog isoform X2 [Cynoglossus semilaevis]
MNSDYEHRIIRQIHIQNNGSDPASSPRQTGTSSPFSSRTFGDRFIPTRAGANWDISFHWNKENEKVTHSDASPGNVKDGLTYTALLKNELLGAGIENVQEPQTPKRSLFSYSPHTKRPSLETCANISPYSLSTVSNTSHTLLGAPRRPTRKVSESPFKVLDASGLQDDFYLNLVDWSSLNVLGVGLGSCVYMWSAYTSQVVKLCDLSPEGDSVTSVAWTERGDLMAVGTHRGYVQIWDAATGKKICVWKGHRNRVGVLAWNSDQLSSGSCDCTILQRDTRTSPLQSVRRLKAHKREVCGLKWNSDRKLLASGDNDNKLLVWNQDSPMPLQTFKEHQGAVKAIAWSPHQRSLLASGGGSADCSIRIWSSLQLEPVQRVDTGSQVCNLVWSKHTNELVSTHGYADNKVMVWKCPSLTQVASLTHHSDRVLHLAMSPDGEVIVTGAGGKDETLCFWKLFSNTRSTKDLVSNLNLFTRMR